MKVKIFGQLAEITAGDLLLNDVKDTNTLVEKLHRDYPAMMSVKYLIAVDKKVINKNTVLNNDSVVALLPPFSGAGCI